MSITETYKCDQCKKITHDLLNWFILDGDFWWNDSSIRFKFAQQLHWCAHACFLKWFETNEKFKVQDGQFYRVKND